MNSFLMNFSLFKDMMKAKEFVIGMFTLRRKMT